MVGGPTLVRLLGGFLLLLANGFFVTTEFAMTRVRQFPRAEFSGPLYWWTWLTSPFIHAADHIAKGLLSLFGVAISRSWTEEGVTGG